MTYRMGKITSVTYVEVTVYIQYLTNALQISRLQMGEL